MYEYACEQNAGCAFTTTSERRNSRDSDPTQIANASGRDANTKRLGGLLAASSLLHPPRVRRHAARGRQFSARLRVGVRRRNRGAEHRSHPRRWRGQSRRRRLRSTHAVARSRGCSLRRQGAGRRGGAQRRGGATRRRSRSDQPSASSSNRGLVCGSGPPRFLSSLRALRALVLALFVFVYVCERKHPKEEWGPARRQGRAGPIGGPEATAQPCQIAAAGPARPATEWQAAHCAPLGRDIFDCACAREARAAKEGSKRWRGERRGGIGTGRAGGP